METKFLSTSSRRVFFYAALFLLCAILLLLTTRPAQAGEAKAPYAYDAGDFQFCPKGKAFADPSCNTAVDNMATAVSEARTAAASGISGTIYVRSGNFSYTADGSGGGLIYIQDFNYGTSLVIQGGAGGGTTNFVRGVWVVNNDLDGLDLTVKDVVISTSDAENGFLLFNNPGEVNITIQNTTVSSPQQGVVIDNDNHAGDVVLDNVTADGNGGYNIFLYEITGKVTLNQIEASSNSANEGIYLSNITAQKGVTLSGVTANSNTTTNIYLYMITGNVTMSDIEASGSGGAGITFVNITGNVKVEDAAANTNTANNIQASTVSGDLTLEQVTASDSVSGHGVYATAVSGKKGVMLDNVTASGNNNNNIQMIAIPSNVSLTDVTANDCDTGRGINLYDIDGSKGVTVNTATAINNYGNNIQIQLVDGNATLSGITAQGGLLSTGEGLHLEFIYGKKGVTLSSSNIDDNALRNIYIYNVETGNVLLSNVTANGSKGFNGIEVGAVWGSNGVIFKTVTANENDGSNIYINTITGGVSMTGVTANSFVSGSTSDYGIIMDGIGSRGVTMKTVSANYNPTTNIDIYNVAGSVSLSSVNANSSSSGTGIDLNTIHGSKGVTLKTVTADENNGTNIAVNNIDANATLSGVYANKSTVGHGISISNLDGTKGVSLKTVTASQNGDHNIYIYNINYGGASLASVMADQSTLGSGIALSTINGSKGVSLKSVTANTNHSTNINIGSITGSVTGGGIMADWSTNGSGVNITSIDGAKGVSLKGVDANHNISYGVRVTNLTAGNASLGNVTASDNVYEGVYVDTITGSATLSGLTASDCTFSGCRGIYVHDVDGSKGVRMKTATAEGNDGDNVYIYDVFGDVSLSNVNASNSDALRGIYVGAVDGARGVSFKTVTAVSNHDNNIYINDVEPGGVVMNGVTADQSNTNNGAYVSSVVGTIMVMKSTFNDNDAHGLYTYDNGGLIALKAVQGNNNANQDGALLQTNDNMLVCSSQFVGNGNGSLAVEAYGVYGNANGYSLTIAGTDLSSGPPYNLSGPAEKSAGTTLHVNESNKCKVIPVIP